MANTISGLKRVRQNKKRRLRNKVLTASIRTQVKKVLAAIRKKERPGAEAALTQLYRMLDKAAGKGVFHQNTAARYKARLAVRIAALK